MLGSVEIDEDKAKEHFLRERSKRGERNRLSDEKQLRALKNRLAELDKLIASAFEEKVLGTLPEAVCKSLCEKYQHEKEEAERQSAELEKRLAETDGIEAGAEEYIARLKRYGRCEELTREMCLQLIEFIAVSEKPDGKNRGKFIFTINLYPTRRLRNIAGIRQNNSHITLAPRVQPVPRAPPVPRVQPVPRA